MKLLLITILFSTAAANACDLCGTSLIQHPWDPRAGFTFGASEQFTRFRTLQDSGREIDNDADQKLDSSITQIFLGYHLTPRFGIQVNVPLIRKTFRRATEEGILENGSVSGFGDVSLTANCLVIHSSTRDWDFQFAVNAGVQFPTGDSDRVLEEAAEGHAHAHVETEIEPEEEEHHEKHHAHGRHIGRHGGEVHEEPIDHEESAEPHGTEEDEHLPHAIHGHDLALGTGSIDGLLGANFRARYKRIFITGEVEYAVRGSGEHDYDYANDLLWAAGPGVTFIERDTHTLSFQVLCSGETKGEDEFRGVRAGDTAVTHVFIGPKISATWQDRLAADVELEIPVRRENSGIQAVPDYRIRAGVSWSF